MRNSNGQVLEFSSLVKLGGCLSRSNQKTERSSLLSLERSPLQVFPEETNLLVQATLASRGGGKLDDHLKVLLI